MELICIDNLIAKTTLGVNKFEQAILSDVIINLAFRTDITKIAKSDNLIDTVDYDVLSTDIINWLEVQSHELLETLANSMTKYIFDHYPLDWISLSITKVKAIRNKFDVTIKIEKKATDLQDAE